MREFYFVVLIALSSFSCSEAVKEFELGVLAKEQLAAAEQFKNKKERLKNWRVISPVLPFSKEEPFGQPNLKMTKKQLIEFIGEPDPTTKDGGVESLNYDLGIYDEDIYTAFILVDGDFVLWFIQRSCFVDLA